MDNRDEYTYFFSNKTRNAVPPRPHKPHNPPNIRSTHKNSPRINPFAVLADESLDEPTDKMPPNPLQGRQMPQMIDSSTESSPTDNPFAVLTEENLSGHNDARPKMEVPLRPKAENANPNRRHYVTKHVVSATQDGVHTVQKISSSTSERASSLASTPLSMSEQTASAQDNELDILIGPSHHNSSVILTR
jgi:hypothetical protein